MSGVGTTDKVSCRRPATALVEQADFVDIYATLQADISFDDLAVNHNIFGTIGIAAQAMFNTDTIGHDTVPQPQIPFYLTIG